MTPGTVRSRTGTFVAGEGTGSRTTGAVPLASSRKAIIMMISVTTISTPATAAVMGRSDAGASRGGATCALTGPGGTGSRTAEVSDAPVAAGTSEREAVLAGGGNGRGFAAGVGAATRPSSTGAIPGGYGFRVGATVARDPFALPALVLAGALGAMPGG